MLFSTEYLNNSLARLSFIFNIFSKSILVISLFFSTNSIICFICISKFFLFSRIKLFLQDNLLFPLFPPRYIFNCSIIFYNFQLLFMFYVVKSSFISCILELFCHLPCLIFLEFLSDRKSLLPAFPLCSIHFLYPLQNHSSRI